MSSVLLLNFNNNVNQVVTHSKNYTRGNKATNEIVERHSEFEKHFQNEDRTITAATYAKPIHYRRRKCI